MKIAILGAESTGKSTLCHSLVDALSSAGHPAIAVDEYLRQWCIAAKRTPKPEEQAAIAREQAVRTGSHGKQIVVADTTALMTAIYSDVLFHDGKLYPEALKDLETFDYVLVTATDLPWIADGYLRDSPLGQRAIHQRLQEVLRTHVVPYSLVYGHGEQRLKAAMSIVLPSEANGESDSANYSRWMAQCEKCSDAICEHLLFRKVTGD